MHSASWQRNRQSDRQIVIIRIFNASSELVFKVWTGPKHVAQWWGLKDFTTQVTKLDLRQARNI